MRKGGKREKEERKEDSERRKKGGKRKNMEGCIRKEAKGYYGLLH